MNEEKNEIFKFDTKTSGNPVNIILLFSELLSNWNNGLDKNSARKDAL